MTLRKTKIAVKATENHAIRDTWDCEHAAAPFCGVDMPSWPLTMTLKCDKHAGNSRRLERELKQLLTTLCLKNVTTLSCYNFDTREPMLKNLAVCYWESQKSKGALFFHLIRPVAMHYLAKCRNTKIASFRSKAVLLHCQNSNKFLPLLQSCYLQFMLACAAVWLPKSRISGVKVWTVTEP